MTEPELHPDYVGYDPKYKVVAGIDHGHGGYVGRKCRCVECVDDKRFYAARWRAWKLGKGDHPGRPRPSTKQKA